MISCGICERPIDDTAPDDGAAETLCLECASHPVLVRVFTTFLARKRELAEHTK